MTQMKYTAQQGLNAEKRMVDDAQYLTNKLPCTRDYLDTTFSDILLRACDALSKCRPEDPVEFLAYFLLKHNPNNK